jgi:hypothetical protein
MPQTLLENWFCSDFASFHIPSSLCVRRLHVFSTEVLHTVGDSVYAWCWPPWSLLAIADPPGLTISGVFQPGVSENSAAFSKQDYLLEHSLNSFIILLFIVLCLFFLVSMGFLSFYSGWQWHDYQWHSHKIYICCYVTTTIMLRMDGF